MNINSFIGVVAVFVLVALNGFFVAGEFALVKVRSTRIDQLVAEGNRRAKVVHTQIHHLDNYIAATQLGITLASLALGWIGEPSLAHLVDLLFVWMGGQASEGLAHGLAVAVSFAVITALHIILGELVPKSIALQRSESTALFVSLPLLGFSRLFYPFIFMMNSIGNTVVRLLGMQVASEENTVHSVEELEMLVVQSRQAGVLEQQEEVLLRRVFNFEDTMAQQVMLPRTEIVGVPVTISCEDLQATLAHERYTRLPVYEDTIDTIIGVVHLKDVFELGHTPSRSAVFDIRSLLRPVLTVPETTSIGILLTQMRSSQTHFAVVIDEYGGTAGIVTMEDIVEEIVGEVQDEFDTREEGVYSEVEVQADGSSLVDGLMIVDAFAERFGVHVEQTHANTIGGYMLEQLDRLPQIGDIVLVDGQQLRVEEMDHMRIARIHVILKRTSQRLSRTEVPSVGADEAREHEQDIRDV